MRGRNSRKNDDQENEHDRGDSEFPSPEIGRQEGNSDTDCQGQQSPEQQPDDPTEGDSSLERGVIARRRDPAAEDGLIKPVPIAAAPSPESSSGLDSHIIADGLAKDRPVLDRDPFPTIRHRTIECRSEPSSGLNTIHGCLGVDGNA